MRMRQPLVATAVLVLGSIASPARGSGEAVHEGRLASGDRRVVELPDLQEGIWQVELTGNEDSDIDLRLERGGQRWSSQGSGGREDLLVLAGPATRAVIDHYDGPETSFRLLLRRLAPGTPLRLAGRVTGAVEAGSRFAVHELQGPRGRFGRARLDGRAVAAGLTLALYDARWRRVARLGDRGAKEALQVAPGRDQARYLVVEATRPGPFRYELSLDPVQTAAPRIRPDARERGELGTRTELHYHLRTREAGILTVRLRGPARADFDLSIHGPDGTYRESVAADAVEQIALQVGRREDYLVRVFAPDRRSRGEFELVVEPVALEPLALDDPQGPPRVWALFVGVASYRQLTDLTYAASDALSTYELLRREGKVDASRSLVLLDERATRAAVVGALEEIAGRARPEDTFVFFFSGHGGNEAGDGGRGDRADEADGKDEYLSLHDSTKRNTTGDLTDDDLERLLDSIPARRQVLLFDACYSGGFDEVIRDGRYGLFSSLETQQSNEAFGLKAGLLTAMLARALQGEGDLDRDGAVTLSEAASYVARVLPRTCPSCQGTLQARSEHCSGCGADLEHGAGRQVPVIVDRLGTGLVLTQPTLRRDVAAMHAVTAPAAMGAPGQ